ncbi:AP4M [Symbiodinium microadriaticum]|nr:AP4M [Symbiodinium sp. KB8]CAE7381438.1 AP4M [Symbiodinium microadriaticum]
MLMAMMFCAANGYIQCRSLTRFLVIPMSWRTLAGIVLWATGLCINLDADHRLRNLRKPGETGYKVPRGGMFEYISGANFFGEIVEWTGYALAMGFALPGLTFALCTAANIGPRAIAHHHWYLQKFKDQYPKDRKALLPFIYCCGLLRTNLSADVAAASNCLGGDAERATLTHVQNNACEMDKEVLLLELPRQSHLVRLRDVLRMISQFYILSLRGDTIITRDFRGDVVKGTAEIFFRKVKFWHGDAPPIFNLDGVTYVFIKKNGLYFVATTCHNISPAAVVELLTKMAKVFKDFCGMLNEESIRKNFVLVYELLDEMVDFGYPQTTNTEHLKSCIHNEAVVIEAPKLGLNLPQWNPRTVPSNAVHRPVGPTHDAKNKKNEIFVDILERISVLMSSNGFVINSAIDGSIQMKSYLMGNPELKLALNEDIVVKNMDLGGSHGGYGSVILDDCNFHECVDLQDFSDLRTLSFYPPDGEFAVMNYRITGDFRVPFRIFPFAEQQTPHKLEITIKVRADIPESNYGGNVQISCMLPKESKTTQQTDTATAQAICRNS